MLVQTIKQQLKGMGLFFLAGFIALVLAMFFGDIESNADAIPLFMQFALLAWPIISASLIFNQEFRDGSLAYLLGAPHARMQIVQKRIIPSMALALVPISAVQFMIQLTFHGGGQIPIIKYALLYLIILSAANLFSFLPSIISIFSLSLLTGALMLGLIPFTFSLISFWRDDSTSHWKMLRTMMGFFWGEPLALWLLPILPVVLLITWFWGFSKFAEPDYRRTYRKLASCGVVFVTGSMVLVFVLACFFLPVFPDGEYQLTREGHLFRQGNMSSNLTGDNQSFTLKHENKSRYLAETDSELILAMADEKDRIKLIGWKKTDGSTRTIAQIPGAPLQKLIFQPPRSILCLPAKNPEIWTGIDIDSGKETIHPIKPFDDGGDKINMLPVVQMSHGGAKILLATNHQSPWAHYADPLDLYLCQQKDTPKYLGKYQGLPIQLSEQEIVMISYRSKTIEKYRFENEQLTLIQSVSFPPTGYWHIKQDFRYWPVNQPIFGLCRHAKEPQLMRLELNPLTLSLTALDTMGTQYYSPISTPHWSALIKTDEQKKSFLVQRLDREQPPITFLKKDDRIYLHPQIYGFIIFKDWLPKGRIDIMNGKIELKSEW